MMMRGVALLFFLCFFLFGTLAQFSPDKHHKLGWKKLALSHGDQQIKFTLFLKQQNLGLLEKIFWDVSNPKSETYGNYLTMEDLTEIVAPSQQTILRVTNWLSAHGVTYEFVENKDVIIAKAQSTVVEQMLNVALHVFEHASGKQIVRSDAMYTIPDNLSGDIDFIRGVSNFPILKRVKANKEQLNAPATLGDPVILRVRGHSDQFTIDFAPTCLSSNTTNTNPPCQDHPPALANITVNLYSASDVIPSSLTFTGVPDCSTDSGSLSCSITVTGNIINYNLYNISMQSTFVGGQQSSVVVYPYPSMASPALTPEAIKAYYKIPTNQRVINGNVTQAVGEFEQQYYDEADLLLFFKEMGLPYDTPVTVVGPNNQSNPGVEANLDIQYIMAIGVGAPTTFWSIFANSSIEIDDILAWAVAMSNTPNAPIVNSLSYGMTEMAVDQFLGKGYLNRSDVEFQKLAVRGITIIIADGDAGSSDLGEPPMSATTCMPLHADWPSQSPYVTAVSATMFTPLAEPICYLPKEQGGVDCTQLPLGEVPTSVELGVAWTTGGGFSNTSSRPWYQDDFVSQYLTTLTDYGALPPAGYFNSEGRAYPDVAMVGHNLLIAQSLNFMTVDGTSASAPVFAGFVSLLNDIRNSNGLPLLGFLNPILYQIARDYPDAYNDVVVGNNRCGTVDDPPYSPVCCPYGYTAVPGFDAASGLGSPDFAVFSSVILNY